MKATFLALTIAAFFIGGSVWLSGGGSGVGEAGSVENVSMTDGVQTIEVDAKGGYSPRLTLARADVPTVLKVKTRGTFDCSSALRIPSLNYSAYLEPSGVTEVPVPPQKVGTTLQGICSMGMYSFSITFN